MRFKENLSRGRQANVYRGSPEPSRGAGKHKNVAYQAIEMVKKFFLRTGDLMRAMAPSFPSFSFLSICNPQQRQQVTSCPAQQRHANGSTTGCHLKKEGLQRVTFSRRPSGMVQLLMAATLVISCFASPVFPLSSSHLADSRMHLKMTRAAPLSDPPFRLTVMANRKHTIYK